MAGWHHQLDDSCAVLCLVTFSSLGPRGLYCARLPCPWGVSRQECLRGLPCPPPGNLPNPGIEPRSPTLWADSLLSEPPEKLKNTGVGSLSLLLGNFPTQESNWDLLHCRWIFLPAELPGNPQTMYNYHLSLKLTDHFDHADNS